jgi:hypothetical protein
MFWQIDTFWMLKCLSFFGLAGYLSYIFQPSDLCFNLRHSALLEAKNKSDEFVLEPAKTFIVKEKYCVKIDMFQHQLCSELNLTTVPDDLCLEQSREVTAMISQLFLAIFIDLIHIIILWHGIHLLTPTQLAVPVVQVSMLGSVCIILTGDWLRWSNKWINSYYIPSAVPEHPYEFWLLWFGFILIFMKMLEFIVLYRAFKRNRNGRPKIIPYDS